jgi:hypothetical protein
VLLVLTVREPPAQAGRNVAMIPAQTVCGPLVGLSDTVDALVGLSR